MAHAELLWAIPIGDEFFCFYVVVRQKRSSSGNNKFSFPQQMFSNKNELWNYSIWKKFWMIPCLQGF